MALPEQIRKQSEAVQKLYEELNSDDDQPSGGAEADQPAGVDMTDGSTPSGGTSPAPQEQPAPAPTNVAEVERETKPEQVKGENFEQKYRTLQGMYNSEVPRLRGENRQLTERVSRLEQLLSEMKTAPQSQPTPTATNTQPLVSKEEIEEFGPDTVDLLRRLAREETLPYIQKIAELEGVIGNLQSNVVPQVEDVARRQHQTTAERFWADLQRDVPDWQEVNQNPDFHTWLLEFDPLAGTTRQELLEQAQSKFDAGRVVRFFQTWKNINQAHGSAQGAGNPSNKELQAQVAPGKARSASVPTTSDGRTYTPQDIQQFFKDVSMGKYKGREDERNRIERDIFAAQQQGRIVNG